MLSLLSHKYRVLSYRPGYLGWVTDIKVRNRQFRVWSEYSYLGVEEVTDTGFVAIENSESEHAAITPRVIAKAIDEQVA